MATAQDIMLGGFSAGSARAIGGQVQTAITAAGTVITDAFDLTKSISLIGTAGSGSGVQLLPMNAGESMVVYNGGLNPVKVYPGTSTTAINQITAGSPHTLGTNTSAIYFQASSTQVVAFVSA